MSASSGGSPWPGFHATEPFQTYRIRDRTVINPNPPSSLNSQGANNAWHSRCCRRARVQVENGLFPSAPTLSTRSPRQIPQTIFLHPQGQTNACVASSKPFMWLGPYLSFTGTEAGAGVAAGVGTAAGGNSSEARWLLTFSWGARPAKMPDTLKLISRGGTNRCQVESLRQPTRPGQSRGYTLSLRL